MPGKREHQQLSHSSWKVPNPTSTSAVLTVLIWTSLSKSLLSQNPNLKLNVPTLVSVQEGLCIHIPCNYTYDDALVRTSSEPLHGYWLQEKNGHQHRFATGLFTITPGILVATNDEKEKLQTTVEDRFQLTGNLEEGDCSFSILNARLQDTGGYYFRPEDSNLRFNDFKPRYFFNPFQVHSTLQVLVAELTEKPEIVISSAVISGEEAVVTCSTPSPCSGTGPEIQWTTLLTGYKTSQWRHAHTNGRWISGSNFTFTPSLNDQGKSLTCQVWYPDIQKRIRNTVLLVVAGSRSETSGSSVILFVIVLCLIKILVCLLFFFLRLWFLNRRKAPCRGT